MIQIQLVKDITDKPVTISSSNIETSTESVYDDVNTEANTDVIILEKESRKSIGTLEVHTPNSPVGDQVNENLSQTRPVGKDVKDHKGSKIENKSEDATVSRTFNTENESDLDDDNLDSSVLDSVQFGDEDELPEMDNNIVTGILSSLEDSQETET